MISDIAKEDKRLFLLRYDEVMLGKAIAGVGYNFSGEAKITNGESCEPLIYGSIETDGYDFDSWELCGNAYARWRAGWSDGFELKGSDISNKIMKKSIFLLEFMIGNRYSAYCNDFGKLQKFPLDSLSLLATAYSKHSTAQHSTAQHSTAQHSTAQHSTAQHSTAQHSTAYKDKIEIFKHNLLNLACLCQS